MDQIQGRFRLVCSNCGSGKPCTFNELIERLRGDGLLRRNAHPTISEVIELGRSRAGHWRCSECDALGLEVHNSTTDEGNWPEDRLCVSCGKPIGPERVSIMPHVTLCAKCQQQIEQGTTAGDTEYCPRCGAPLILRPTRGAGITRYALVCSGTPPCRSAARGER